MKIKFYILVFLGISVNIFATESTADLLKKIDQIINAPSKYIQAKELRIDSLKNEISKSTNNEQTFHILGEIYDEYKLFNTDSLFKYVNKRKAISATMEKACQQASAMNEAEAMIIAGMYKEAADRIEGFDSTEIDSTLSAYYFHLQHTLYQRMFDNASTSELRNAYLAKVAIYRDSILSANNPESFTYTIVSAGKNNYDKRSLKTLNNYEQKNSLSKHEKAVINYCKAESYKSSLQRDSAEYYYALSAIHDLEMATREYASLQKLAFMLYEDGDIQHAYEYLRYAFKDAVLCKAQLRTMETTAIMPIIGPAYENEQAKNKRQQMILLCIISLSLILLTIAFILVYRQMAKVSALKNETAAMNEQLQRFNEELQNANHELQFSNRIKEEYIGRYMDLCSIYIEKLDNFRREINKAKRENNSSNLTKILPSKMVEDELNDFYKNFDISFLTIFPDFVEKFNALLQDGEQIELKPHETLNTDLRVYALIRLGISDSAKIARFLRYSSSTIYNCRVKMRNKARGERADFEQKVMSI